MIAGVCLSAASCGLLPQPFSHDGTVTNPLLAPAGRAGIKITPVKGTPHGAAFAEELARAFRNADIAAQTGPGPNAGMTLVGRVHAEPASPASRTHVRVLWRILDPKGGPAGIRHQDRIVDASAWDTGETALLRRLARDAVADISPLIADPKGTTAAGPRPIAVLDIDGAPGDGRVSLRRSLAFELRKRGFTVFESKAGKPGAITLKGAVSVKPVQGGDGKELVEITWTVLGPGGRVLGRVNQANAVHAGSLSPNWGTNAVFVARAAAPGVTRIIRGAIAQAAP
ncbi:MAG TPA: hypothetical protein VLN73_01365 [Alphaproteobacteria bacterium]|nr:hypothetical protein [Alphaproteobacteria bacterium]